MRAGRLNRWVLIERNVPTVDSTGNPVDEWYPYYAAWGSVKPLDTGNEKFSSDQPFAEHYYLVSMRWTPALAAAKPHMRIIALDTLFDIERVQDDWDDRREIKIFCKVIN